MVNGRDATGPPTLSGGSALVSSPYRNTRVMTLNIWQKFGSWVRRREEISTWIALLAPDAVCLQEVVGLGSGATQAHELAQMDALQALSYHVATPEPKPEHGMHGTAVLVREQIQVNTVLLLTDLPDHCETVDGAKFRTAVHVRTEHLDIVSVHLTFKNFRFGTLRQHQAVELNQAVEDLERSSGGRLTVVAGDFNAEPDATEIRFLTGSATLEGHSAYYQDAWRVAGCRGPGFTWDNRNTLAAPSLASDRRLDYILVGWWDHHRATPWVRAAGLCCDRALTGTFASDHFGVVADIVTKDRFFRAPQVDR